MLLINNRSYQSFGYFFSSPRYEYSFPGEHYRQPIQIFTCLACSKNFSHNRYIYLFLRTSLDNPYEAEIHMLIQFRIQSFAKFPCHFECNPSWNWFLHSSSDGIISSRGFHKVCSPEAWVYMDAPKFKFASDDDVLSK